MNQKQTQFCQDGWVIGTSCPRSLLDILRIGFSFLNWPSVHLLTEQVGPLSWRKCRGDELFSPLDVTVNNTGLWNCSIIWMRLFLLLSYLGQFRRGYINAASPWETQSGWARPLETQHSAFWMERELRGAKNKEQNDIYWVAVKQIRLGTICGVKNYLAWLWRFGPATKGLVQFLVGHLPNGVTAMSPVRTLVKIAFAWGRQTD